MSQPQSPHADMQEGNSAASRLYLSGPERRRGVRLFLDVGRRVWLKGEASGPLDQYFDDRKNAWLPCPDVSA